MNPNDRVTVGNSARVWTLGEIVDRPQFGAMRPVANLHDSAGNVSLHVPLHELLVVSSSFPTESEVAA